MSKVRKKTEPRKLEFGSIRQKKAGGSYYYRYQLNGQRKEIPLQTDNKEEAEKKAKALVPITQAKCIEVVAAHMSQARGFEMQTQKLLLSEAWNVYSQHPDRAMPHTVSEQLAYQSTFSEFVDFVSNSLQPAEIRQSNPKTFLPKYLPVQTVHEVTPPNRRSIFGFSEDEISCG